MRFGLSSTTALIVAASLLWTRPAMASTALPVYFDCYLPEGPVACADLLAQLTSGSILAAASPSEASLSLEIRDTTVSDPNQTFTRYVMRVFEHDRPRDPVLQTVERLSTALSADIQTQRVTNRALLALASCGQVTSASEDSPGVLVVTSRVASPTDSRGLGVDASSPWSFTAALTGNGNIDHGAETQALGNLTVGALRSSESWLVAAHASSYVSYQKITFNDVSDELTDYDVSLSGIVARSFAKHWSIALNPLVRHSPNVKNFALNANLLAGIEFNLVPFKLGTNEGNLIAEYSVGPEFSRYRTVNTRGETHALYAVHTLSVSAEWHFSLVDPAVSVGAFQDLTHPELSSLSVTGDFQFRVGSRVAIGPHLGYRYQSAVRNQPLNARAGTLQAAQDAQAFSTQSFAAGITIAVTLGNSNLSNLDNRWKLARL